MTITEITECPFLRAALGVAHKKGFLPKERGAVCEYEGTCDKVNCLKVENPNFRSIYLRQSEGNQPQTQTERFTSRAEKTLAKIQGTG